MPKWALLDLLCPTRARAGASRGVHDAGRKTVALLAGRKEPLSDKTRNHFTVPFT